MKRILTALCMATLLLVPFSMGNATQCQQAKPACCQKACQAEGCACDPCKCDPCKCEAMSAADMRAALVKLGVGRYVLDSRTGEIRFCVVSAYGHLVPIDDVEACVKWLEGSASKKADDDSVPPTDAAPPVGPGGECCEGLLL